MTKCLEFEKPIVELYEKIDQLKKLSKSGTMDLEDEIKRMVDEAEANAEADKKFKENLLADKWEVVLPRFLLTPQHPRVRNRSA